MENYVIQSQEMDIGMCGCLLQAVCMFGSRGVNVCLEVGVYIYV